MKKNIVLFSLIVLVLAAAFALYGTDPVENPEQMGYKPVSDSTYTLTVLKAVMTDEAPYSGARTSDPNMAFVFVYFKTDDPDMQAMSLTKNFVSVCGALRTPATISTACGGGMVDGENMCQFILPKSAKNNWVLFRPTGYPGIELNLEEPEKPEAPEEE